MNPHASEQIDAITGAMTLPIHVVSRILGISAQSVRSQLPIVQKGYRSKEVTIAAMREYLAKHSTRPVYVRRTTITQK